MFRKRLYSVFKLAYKINSRLLSKSAKIVPPAVGLVTVTCEQSQFHNVGWDDESLSHEFLIQQASTVNVNAATQLLTVTLVAIQDTSERLREALSKEISLVKEAVEWGEEDTPAQHWDQLVAIRGSLCDLNHNLRMLFGYMDYAEKLATVAAEISYLSGNVAASDAMCERIEQATRSCRTQRLMNQELRQECLQLQQQAIMAAPQLQDKLSPGTISEENTA